MGLFKDYVNQTRKPEGKLGKMMLKGMNSGHAKMADWGMAHLKAVTPENIIELGCGGGRNAGELLKKYNKNLITEGRLEVINGDVSALALPDQTYDLATAFETIYFWPGLEDCFKEVARVLKDGGFFMIVNESDGTDQTSLKFEKIIDGMKCYTIEQITQALKTAGFTSIKTDHHKSRPWITVLAKK